MISYNKIVRNKIPHILEDLGIKCDLETLPKERSLEYLYTTLISYIYDSFEKKSLCEIIECIDLLTSIALEYGYTEEEIMAQHNKINKENGSYSQKIFLKNTY